MFYTQLFETYLTNSKIILVRSGDLYFVNTSNLIYTSNLFKEKMKICFFSVLSLFKYLSYLKSNDRK